MKQLYFFMGGHSILRKHGIHFYFIGLITLTLGIALAVQSQLGTSPFDALLVGLFRTFGLSIGSWEVVVGFSMIFGYVLMDRKRTEFFAFIISVVKGIVIDTWLFIIGDIITPQTWMTQSLCIVFSLFFTGLGIAIYLQSLVAPNPMDRSMIIVANLTGWGMTASRALISVILVIIAFFFDGAIGLGTLANALLASMIIQYFLPTLEKLRQKSLAKLRLHA